MEIWDFSVWGKAGSGQILLQPFDIKKMRDIFTKDCSDRSRGNGLKLKDSRFRLDIKRKIFQVL